MKRTQTEDKALRRARRAAPGRKAGDLLNGVVSILPQLDPEVAKRVLDQFPSFADACSSIVGWLKGGLGIVADGNADNMSAANAQTRDALSALETELAKDDLSDEGRKLVIEGITSILDDVVQMDAANKAFLSRLFQGALIAALVTVVCMGSPMGLKLNIPVKLV